MAWTYDNATGADVGAALLARINGGTLEITDASSVVLAALTLPNPAGTVSNKVLTLGTISAVTIGTTGTAALARIKDSGGTVRVSGLTVGLSGTDLVVNSTTFTSGKTCTITSGTITQP
jgi:hypothetical protein